MENNLYHLIKIHDFYSRMNQSTKYNFLKSFYQYKRDFYFHEIKKIALINRF